MTFDFVLTRRQMIALAAAATTAPVVLGGAPRAVAEPGSQRSVDFGGDWRFSLLNTTGEDAQAPAPDDPSWRAVELPHDWSIELDPVDDEFTTGGTGFLPGGLGWYRKTFALPPETAGKKISVEFDGVYMDSEIIFNGQRVGAHPYGYTGFAIDLTELARTDGGENELLVKARNQIPSSRWYSGSGIYRDVHLVVTDPVHVVRHGITVTTPGLAESLSDHATVHVDTTAVAESGATRAELTVVLRDPEGAEVARAITPVDLAPQPRTFGLDLRVDDPQLWSVASPALHTAEVSLSAGGSAVDSTGTPFGIRWFAFDPERGFSLNGEPMKLQGVNLHHDLGALGAATSYDAIVRQLRIMRSMGVNAVRTSHNPPSPQLLRAAEREGVLLQVEAFDCWRTGKTDHDYHRFFDEHSDADLTEMVEAAKNCPAVIMWSIGNEIPDSTSPVGVPIARRLVDRVRALDPTRPVVIGSDKHRSVPADGSPQDEILRMLDGVGLNYNNASSVDELHAKYPQVFLFESESSSETSTRGVYDSPHQLNTGENHTPGKRGTSSYDNNLSSWTYSGEYGLKKDRDRAFFAGQFLWSGIDYIGEPTPYSDVFPVKASFFGAVDTAGFAKDQYHLFRSQWTREPMVHLVPMNWTDHRPGEPVAVWTHSNAPTVELLLNGRSLGEKSFDRKTTTDGREYLETTEPTGDDKTVTDGPFPGSYTSPNGSAGKLHLTWEVPFEPGELVAVAKRDGAEVARDVLRTAGAAAEVRLSREDVGALSFVTAEVVDVDGVLVPSAEHELTFTATGGQVLGTDNGKQDSAENYGSATRKAFGGKALAIVPAGADVRVTMAVPARPAETTADASYSGSADTVPAAMIDGDPATGWSNHYAKEATGLLPAISAAHARDWVSIAWPEPRQVDAAELTFTVDSAHAVPASIEVRYWDGSRFAPVRGQSGDPAATTRITFEPVTTDRLRIELTSANPGAENGFLGIGELLV
jgi:beta-galactosidase